MSFSLSPNTNKNKTFLINHIDVEKRLDPFYYTPQFDELIRLNKSSIFPVEKIGHLAHFVIDGIHKTPTYDETGLPFIQANNISEGEINFHNNVKRVNKHWRQEVLKRYTPEAGDILITKDGTIGVAATVPEGFSPFSIFVSVLAIRPKKDIINPEYLRILISSEIIQKQILRATRGAVLSHLLLEEARELKIPLPSKKIQAKFVKIVSKASISKKQKETEAQRLLDSIDDYLLSELEVKIPEQKVNSLQNRIFTRPSTELLGGRYDPFYYQNHYEIIINILNDLDNTKCLNELLIVLESGSRPKGGVSNIQNGILSFGGEHVNNQCEVEVKKPKFIPQDYHNLHKSTETHANDLLLVKDGATTGKIGIINRHEYIGKNINEHVFLMRTKNSVNSDYLLYYLNSLIGKLQIKREITGGTVTGITKKVVKNLQIILPNLDKQTKIANHIIEIRNHAKQLQQEAKLELKQAKNEVEAMILGEA